MTIEGWTATMAYVVLSLVIRLWKVPRWLRVVLPGAFLVLVVLKGSAPGGRSKRADFDRIRAAQSA